MWNSNFATFCSEIDQCDARERGRVSLKRMQQALIDDVLCPLGALFHCLSHYIVQVATHIFQIALRTLLYDFVVLLYLRLLCTKCQTWAVATGTKQRNMHCPIFHRLVTTTAFSCSGQTKTFYLVWSKINYQMKAKQLWQHLLKVMSIRSIFATSADDGRILHKQLIVRWSKNLNILEDVATEWDFAAHATSADNLVVPLGKGLISALLLMREANLIHTGTRETGCVFATSAAEYVGQLLSIKNLKLVSKMFPDGVLDWKFDGTTYFSLS